MAGKILSPHAGDDPETTPDAPPPLNGERVPPHGGATGREGLPSLPGPQRLPQAPHPQTTWS
jgi:hypothetical protein